MKYVIAFVSTALTVTVCWAAGIPSGNPVLLENTNRDPSLHDVDPMSARILFNSDFEDGLSDPWYDNSPNTVHWLVEDFASPSEVSNPTPTPVTGSKYLRATRNAQLQSGLVILRAITYTALPGDQVSFRFWIRSRYTEGNNLELMMSVNNNETLLLSMSRYSTSVNVEWRTLSVALPLTQATEVTLVFYGYCGSNPEDGIALDDILIQSIEGEPSPTTSTIIPTTSPTLIPTTTIAVPPCGATYQNDAGTLNSPNYPEPYGFNEDCRYSIKVSTGKRVRLEFVTFETESGYDFVTVYDGSATNSAVLLRASGNVIQTVTTTGSNCLIVHTSDSKTSLSGWSAKFTAV